MLISEENPFDYSLEEKEFIFTQFFNSGAVEFLQAEYEKYFYTSVVDDAMQEKPGGGVICILRGGPERIILDAKNKKWRFEDHPHCGPVVTRKDGDPLTEQPNEDSPFWNAVNLWYAQGKRTTDPKTGEIWCVWDKPKMQKMRHIGGRHYELMTDDEAHNAIANRARP